ncbi:hypothetical protein [Salinibacter ruber]|uniref:hypothetical protein n=1 Tax=Salinibacter ruber TaxID=146919 RepID=UPI0020739EF5|nr:hypothetical protein [Salinibacter ruber]
MLPILPGQEGSGKPVQCYITESAKKRLKNKGARLGQTGSDLARRATRMLTRRVEETPAEAPRHIAEESGLYRELRQGDAQSFQVYLPVKTKRRAERAVVRLRRGPGGRPDQKSLLQAAARVVIETPDEKMRPPLPRARDRPEVND